MTPGGSQMKSNIVVRLSARSLTSDFPQNRPEFLIQSLLVSRQLLQNLISRLRTPRSHADR